VVRDPSGRHDPSDLAAQVSELVATPLDGAPVPVIVGGSSVTVLLPLVEPAAASAALTDLRTAFDPVDVLRRGFDIQTLAALAPLGGRLGAPPEPDGIG
jgi:hypothetical protein